MWIFGYGSLVWKVDFPYEEKLPGYVKGFQRRFWQASEDHRGVPGKPGRVATLVSSNNSEDRVWGIAYQISDREEKSVLANLDYREKDGYTKVPTTFFPKDILNPNFHLHVYIANESNPFYLGPESVTSIANQILGAVGPSGKNIDYVFHLADAMRQLAPDERDDHLFDIEQALKIMQENSDMNIVDV